MLRDYVHSSELTKHEQGIYLGIRKKERQTDKQERKMLSSRNNRIIISGISINISILI